MHTSPNLSLLSQLQEQTQNLQHVYQPTKLNLQEETDLAIFNELLKNQANIQVFDSIANQLTELVKCEQPLLAMQGQEAIQKVVNKKLGSTALINYGNWFYYPWSNKLVHVLPEKDFITVRTNRNKYKITEEEQQTLATKKIGVVGLSVGQSVSLTLAMERGFGELRIADFDELDLSNLNRIRSGVHNIKLRKTVIVAREIAELDPYLKVVCFEEGINEANMQDFLQHNGKLDLLIDECDSFDIKIQIRQAAKAFQIPVLMEGSDRCTIDIERFDLEKNRPILHGMVDHLDIANYKNLKTFDERIPYISAVVGLETLSPRMKASAVELMSTISTWPQLASAVTYGGGVSADLSRKILLKHIDYSGRYFLDLDEVFEKNKEHTANTNTNERPAAWTTSTIEQYIIEHETDLKHPEGIALNNEQLHYLIEAAKWAPSGGNNQPWRWHYQNKRLHLFMELRDTLAYLDPDYLSSYQSMGASIENLLLAAAKLQLKVNWRLSPTLAPQHLAIFSFDTGYEPTAEELRLESIVPLRHTNRKSPERSLLTEQETNYLKQLVSETSGAQLTFIDRSEDIKQLADIATATDLLRMFIPEAHEDFITREMRWTPEQAIEAEDGIGIHTLDLNNNDSIGIKLLKDRKMIDFLQEINGGSGFGRLLAQQFSSASALGLISMSDRSFESLMYCGVASEKMWLGANAIGLQIHPLNVPLLFFYKNSVQKNLSLNLEKTNYLMKAEQTLNQLFKQNGAALFMFRIFRDSNSPERTVRKSNHKIFSIGSLS